MPRWTMLLALWMLAIPGAAQTSLDNRLKDLNFISTQLPKVAPNFFAQLSRSDFQQAVAGVQANLSTFTDAQFYVRLAQLVAMAEDSHTNLYLNQAPGFQQLPLHLRWLNDGIFVTSAGPEYTRTLGTRIISIGNTSIDGVLQRLGTVIPHENNQWVHYVAQSYLTQQQILQGLGIVPEGSPTQITFQSLDGSEFTLAVDASNETRVSLLSSATGTIPDYLLNTSQYYWFTYSQANRMLYFKYNVCANDAANPFPTFAATVLSTLDANPVDTLVFDFRGNTGGDSSVINPLFNGVIQRLPRLRQNPAFALYVAIDKGTISSGVDDAQVFKQPSLGGIARLIGEATGGRPQHFGNVASFTLPGSGVMGQYSQQFFAAPSYLPQGASALEPDIAIPIRSTDYFARLDPVMAAILVRSTGAPLAGGGDVATVNAASDRAEQGIAPGSLATAFGTFSTTPDQVLIDGVPAQVLAATASQVNFVVPEAIALGTATISIQVNGGAIASGALTIAPTGPGFSCCSRGIRSSLALFRMGTA